MGSNDGGKRITIKFQPTLYALHTAKVLILLLLGVVEPFRKQSSDKRSDSGINESCLLPYMLRLLEQPTLALPS
jgi:hypothetical protein